MEEQSVGIVDPILRWSKVKCGAKVLIKLGINSR